MRTIDLTPTWREIMPALIAVLQNGTTEGQDMARAELLRLADIADQLNNKHRAQLAEQAQPSS
jgi:hypothetical protein